MDSRPPASPKTGIAIGIPSVGWQPTLFVKGLLQLAMPLNCVVTYKVVGTRRYGDQVRPVAEADNIILHEALQEGATHLFFLEEDVIIPPMGLRQLMATMGRNPGATVVTSIVTSKSIPPEPLIYRSDGEGAYWDFKRGEVFEIASCHMGGTLIRLADLAKVKVPTVDVVDYPTPGAITPVHEFFRTSSYAIPGDKTRQSQDIFFCQLLRQAGLHILADAGVQPGHFDVNNSILFGMPGGGPPRQTDAEVVNLGCGLDWDFIDGIRPLRVDLHEANHPDFRADLRALPPEWTGRFDIVYSSHVLEHFDRYDLGNVFAEMVRVCKPGGEIRLVLPSLDWAVEQLRDGVLTSRVIDVIWGGRSVPAVGPYPEMYHKMGINRALMLGLAGKHKLGGRPELTGYNEVYRLFKPPVSKETMEWLKSKEEFGRCFISDKVSEITTVPAPESTPEPTPVAVEAQ